MTTKQIAFRLQPEGGDKVVGEAKRVESALVQAQTAGSAATEKAIATSDRQVAALKRTADQAGASLTAMQARIEALAGGSTRFSLQDQGSAPGNARARPAATTLWAADDAYEERARRLKALLDPAAAAQDRFNDELREYDQLAARGAISTELLAQAQAMARSRFDQTTAALNRQVGGLSRLAVASRANLLNQFADVGVTAAMGMNPAMIAMQQGPQIAMAWKDANIALSGSLLATGAAVTALAGGTAVLVAAWQSGEAASLDYTRAVTGLGRTAGVSTTELEALAATNADLADISVSSAREQAIAYLSTGKIGAAVIGDLIRIGKDYAAVMGMDAEEATKSLAAAMLSPDKAARDLTFQMGLLDQKTLDHIDSLVKLGKQEEAQAALMRGLEDAMSGHAQKVGEIASAWDWAARTVSNYWDQLGRAMFTTPDERLANLDKLIVREQQILSRTGRPRSSRLESLERQRNELFAEGYDDMRRGAYSRANQEAEETRRRQEANNRGNRRRTGGQGEADRLAREALQRQRREEDLQAALDGQIAQATQDFDRIRALEAEERLRTRIRQLIDDGMTAEAARTKATEEQARLQEVLDTQAQREASKIARQASIDADRIAGMGRQVAYQERNADLEERILRYRQAGHDLVNATGQATRDLLAIEKARADQLARANREAAAEQELSLARARGDANAVRRLEADDWIRRRASEIEQRNNWNAGEGGFEAKEQWQALLTAEAAGARRSWVRGFASDIRQSGIGNALGDQFDYAGERLLNKVIDGFLDFDWSSIFSGKSGGSGVGSWINQGLSWLFGGKGVGKNAAGTDYWSGGLTWVGERGPELADLPRGTKIFEHNRSMQMAASGARMGAQPVAFTFAPVIHAEGAGPREIEAIRAEMQALARSLPSIVPRIVNDARARRIIA